MCAGRAFAWTLRKTSLPTLLAIDTAGESCSLALARDGNIELVRGEAGRTHLEDVVPMVERLLARHGISPSACDAFAFAGGPGSFTGLRVACTLVQGLALGTSRPVVRVGHLDALVEAGLGSTDLGSTGLDSADLRSTDLGPKGASAWAGPVLCVLDARMDQAYWGLYERRGAGWAAAAPPAVGRRADLMTVLDRRQPEVLIGRAAWLERYIAGRASVVRDAAVDAGVVARLARGAFLRGEVLSAGRAVPLYVRDRVAQTVAERREARVEHSP